MGIEKVAAIYEMRTIARCDNRKRSSNVSAAEKAKKIGDGIVMTIAIGLAGFGLLAMGQGVREMGDERPKSGKRQLYPYERSYRHQPHDDYYHRRYEKKRPRSRDRNYPPPKYRSPPHGKGSGGRYY